jgi:hypothetical protein
MTEESKNIYLRAATCFEMALRQISPKIAKSRTHRGGATVDYFLKMERANSLFFSNDPAVLDEAIRIFDEVLRESPSNSPVHLRLARALYARVRFKRRTAPSDETGIAADLNRAKDVLEKGVDLILTDPLTGPDHWINISMRIQLGFAWWCLSGLDQRGQNGVGGLASLRKAVDVTYQGYEYWEKIQDGALRESSSHKPLAHKAVSNMLYYAAAIVSKQSPVPQEDIDYIHKLIRIYQGISLEPKEYYREFFKTRDNLMRAYEAVGEIDVAAKYAHENYIELRAIAEKIENRALLPKEIEETLKRNAGVDSGELSNFRSAYTFLKCHRGWT